MRKQCLLLLFVLTTMTNLVAQDAPKEESPWRIGADVNSTFFQSAFFNWTEGGENTITIGILGNAFAKYKKDKITWDNNLLLQYSIQQVGSMDNPFVKNIDKFELLSFAGHEITDKFYYSFLGSLKTQITPTENTDEKVLSKFFAPAEILIGPGIKYGWGDKKSKDNMVINISPATMKMLVVANQDIADAGTFTGVPATFDTSGVKLTDGQTLRLEFGASLLGTYRVNLSENVTYQTNLELFSNYLENPQNIDVKWFNMLNMKVWKLITLTLSTDLRYDKDVLVPVDLDGDGIKESTDNRVRFAQTFGIGIGYKFGN